MAKETWGADFLVVWSMAIVTDGFVEDKLSFATKDSMGVQFLRRAVDMSIQPHLYRCQYREERFKESYPRLSSIRQWLRALLAAKNGRDWTERKNPDAGHVEDTLGQGIDAGGWKTDEDEAEWEARFGGIHLDDDADSSDGDLEWLQCDDILGADAP